MIYYIIIRLLIRVNGSVVSISSTHKVMSLKTNRDKFYDSAFFFFLINANILLLTGQTSI